MPRLYILDGSKAIRTAIRNYAGDVMQLPQTTLGTGTLKASACGESLRTEGVWPPSNFLYQPGNEAANSGQQHD